MDLKELQGLIKGRVEFDHPLAAETTYKLGGPAAALADPEDSEDTVKLFQWVRKHKARVLYLGGGSNVLFCDRGFDGLVMCPGPGLREVKIQGGLVTAGAGAPLASVMNRAAEGGLGGLEFCAGIPGTVGGAVIGNAGGKDQWVGERVEEVRAVDPDGKVRKMEGKEVAWFYRNSSLKGSGLFLTHVTLRLPRVPAEEVRQRNREYWEERKTRQPLGRRNAGSTFKNPIGEHAGKLLEEAGLKGFRSGAAQVSEVHANFINAEEGARAADVVAVMREAQRRVLERSGIRLEPETLPLGDWKVEEVADVWWNLPKERFL